MNIFKKASAGIICILLIFSIFQVTGCSFIDDFKDNLESRSEQRKENSRRSFSEMHGFQDYYSKEISKAMKDNNQKALKDLFCETVLENTYDIDEGLKYVFGREDWSGFTLSKGNCSSRKEYGGNSKSRPDEFQIFPFFHPLFSLCEIRDHDRVDRSYHEQHRLTDQGDDIILRNSKVIDQEAKCKPVNVEREIGHYIGENEKTSPPHSDIEPFAPRKEILKKRSGQGKINETRGLPRHENQEPDTGQKIQAEAKNISGSQDRVINKVSPVVEIQPVLNIPIVAEDHEKEQGKSEEYADKSSGIIPTDHKGSR